MVLSSRVSRRASRSRKLLFAVIPACVLLAAAAVLLLSLLPPAALPASTAASPKTTPYLTHFQNDLGVVSDLSFTTVSRKSSDSGKGSLALVNKDLPCAAAETSSLVSVYEHASGSYLLSGVDVRLQQEVLPDLNEMMDDFRRITGNRHVMLSDGYRTEKEQQRLYERSLKLHGREDSAAKPGYSESHTGYAFNFSLYTDDDTVMDFTGEGDGAWLLRNCYRYGFILRYPEDKTAVTGYTYQPWHFRYVGRPHAYLMHLKQYCLEEYLDYLSRYPADGEHIRVTDNENHAYEIYYVPAGGERTALPVPAEKPYAVSGDNRGGFIVTATLS